MERNALRQDLARRFRALLAEEAFDLWDLDFAFQAGRTVVRVFVDREPGVTLADCAYWNKKLGRYLEAEDLIPGRYVLEVGSPGIERSLARPEQYQRYVGRTVEVRLHEPRDGRRNLRGELRAAGEESIVLESSEAGTMSIAYGAIRRAHLVADPWEGLRSQESRRKR